MEDPPIASRSNRLLQLICQIEALIHNGCNDDYKVSVPTLLAEAGRYRVWTENIGAHRQGKISLDYRLRQSSRMQRRAVSLLDDLIVALEKSKETRALATLGYWMV